MSKLKWAARIGISLLCACLIVFAALHSSPQTAARTRLVCGSLSYSISHHYGWQGIRDKLSLISAKMTITDNYSVRAQEADSVVKNLKEFNQSHKNPGKLYGVEVENTVGAGSYCYIKKIGFLYFANFI